MRDGASGLYKIGCSIDPTFRERTLLSQTPLIELHSYWKDQWIEVEKYLHRRFADKRHRGEWFSLDDQDVDAIFYLFMFDERVDLVGPPERLRHWCTVQAERWQLEQEIKAANRAALEATHQRERERRANIQSLAQAAVEPPGIGTEYSSRTLGQMRSMIEYAKNKADVGDQNSEMYRGFAKGVIWASGVD